MSKLWVWIVTFPKIYLGTFWWKKKFQKFGHLNSLWRHLSRPKIWNMVQRPMYDMPLETGTKMQQNECKINFLARISISQLAKNALKLSTKVGKNLKLRTVPRSGFKGFQGVLFLLKGNRKISRIIIQGPIKFKSFEGFKGSVATMHTWRSHKGGSGSEKLSIHCRLY